jgi:hypothetical protein
MRATSRADDPARTRRLHGCGFLAQVLTVFLLFGLWLKL